MHTYQDPPNGESIPLQKRVCLGAFHHLASFLTFYLIYNR